MEQEKQTLEKHDEMAKAWRQMLEEQYKEKRNGQERGVYNAN
jgi:hypothetical protein